MSACAILVPFCIDFSTLNEDFVFASLSFFKKELVWEVPAADRTEAYLNLLLLVDPYSLLLLDRTDGLHLKVEESNVPVLEFSWIEQHGCGEVGRSPSHGVSMC